MQTAQPLPLSVGVSPGTTTMVLAGPIGETVGCENPARAARQRYLMFPPGKYVAAAAALQNAGGRIKRVLDPYGTIEGLNGAVRRRWWQRRQRNLGIVLAPNGDRSPHPSYELVASGKDFGPSAYCTRRPERGPNYRESTTSMYPSEMRNHGLGAVPTDMQLATQAGYTPVMSSWIPFKQGMWSPTPWIPPQGQPATYGPAFMTPHGRGFAGPVGDVVPSATAPVDPATAAVHELQRHQERMYWLGILSAGAVASTALVNVFRYSAERKDARKRYGKTAAEPAAMISGARRRR
jgi:hypothetical protein